ncbi:AIG2-like protein [Nemania sp. NC0429]|nr:AIG2-like protein [Nemania sp. NC0429]
MSESQPKPVFIYGTLCALPLLAWVLTGDASSISAVSKLIRPATIYGYVRYSVKGCDYPAVIKHEPPSFVEGYLLTLESTAQRKKLDDFEGEAYKLESVAVTLLDAEGSNPEQKETIEADIYLWAGNVDTLTFSPWELNDFERERLGDWLDLFEGMELVGGDE